MTHNSAYHEQWRRRHGIKPRDEHLSEVRKFDDETKFCPDCEQTRPHSAFHKASNRPSGLQNICKECMKVRAKKRLESATEGSDLRERLRAQNREAERRRRKKRRKGWTTTVQYYARLLVDRAIRTGRLKRLPCEVCGEPKTHAHHDDYERPLEVRWLCATHHEAVHHSTECPLVSP